MLSIFIHTITNRARYVFDHFFNAFYGIDYEFITNRKEFEAKTGPKLNYSTTRIGDEPYICAHSILFEDDVKKQEIIVSEWNEYRTFFQSDRDSILPFDLFAAGFYLLSRYEEYLSSDRDEHGRFKAENSLAVQKNFIDRPVVDEWALCFKDAMQRRYPELQFKERKMQFIPTLDIDNAYAYLFKGVKRTVGATARSLMNFDFSGNMERWKVLMNKKKDPYDNYEYICALHQFYNLRPVTFFPVGKTGKYDKNLPVSNTFYRHLIQGMMAIADIGLHPSYGSSRNYNALSQEHADLCEVTGESIDKSRQHFLRLFLPGTYRNMEKLGIQEDYSMGYSVVCGFRAGTCTPFPFFDLLNNEIVNLKVIPFQVMDSVFRYHYKTDFEASYEIVQNLFQKVQRVGGVFVTIWHNENLHAAKDHFNLRKLYEKTLQLIDTTQKQDDNVLPSQ
jgi:hypothetical protein